MLRTIPGVRCRLNHLIPPDTDIVILQRPRLPLCDKGILEAHQDKVLIVEIDDHPDYIGVDSDWLRGCHAIQCSTEPLAEICRTYNPNVMVFPNQIAELGPIKERQGIGGRVCIFYGAQNRENDWAPIMPAINRIIGEFGDRIAFSVVHDRAFYDALESGKHDKEFYPFCEYSQYRRLIQRCDIALLPLEDTPFNRCKSDVKFLECAAEGVAVLAGTFDSLTHADPNSYTWYFNEATFEHYLRSYIENPKIRAGDTANAYAYVRDNRLLSQHYRRRYDWYRSLVASKPELDASLFERCPELKGSLQGVS